MQLRPYQQYSHDEVLKYLHLNPILVICTGGGKTYTACRIIQTLARLSKLPDGVLWLAHRKELISQAAAALRALGFRVVIIAAGCATQVDFFGDCSGPLIYVASVDTIARRRLPKVSLVVSDECFPAGTMVDGKPIESLKIGDYVKSYNHKMQSVELKPITRIFKSNPISLVTVHFKNGSKMTCTFGHPIFTATGQYWPAGLLLPSDEVSISKEAEYATGKDYQNKLLGMRKRSIGVWTKILVTISQGAGLLFGRMQKSIQQERNLAKNGADKPQVCLATNEEKQSDEEGGNQGESFQFLKRDGMEADCSHGERENAVYSANDACSEITLENGTSNPHHETSQQRLSRSLQSGYRESGFENSNRNRWRQPLRFGTESPGQKKGHVFEWVGVDRVEIHEQGNTGGFDGLCPDGYVYNIEVEGNHNYFANGILVHNCHHDASKGRHKILDALNSIPHLGLTATPFRLDGRGLGECGYGKIIVGAWADDLCANGTLHAPKVYSVGQPDLSGVRKIGADYNLGQLARKVNNPTHLLNIVANWKLKTPGRRTVAFCVDRDHSRAMAATFQRAGVPAEHLDGESKDREGVIRRMVAGEIQVVCNCMVWTEGTDIPSLEVAILDRSTASLNLHIQTVGRIMRASAGKTEAIVLDFSGNHDMHGLVTRRLEYSLDGKIVGEKDPLGLRRCGGCFLLYAPSLKQCPSCGWEPQKKKLTVPAAGQPGRFEELEEFEENFEYRARYYRNLISQADAAGFKQGWAAFRYKERFGNWPEAVNGELVNPGEARLEVKREVYWKFRRQGEEKGFKPGYAAARYKEIFGEWPSRVVMLEPCSGAVASQAAPLVHRMLPPMPTRRPQS